MLNTIIFIGRSGCGKGTQAALLKNLISRFDEEGRQILYIESGEHFRRFIRGENHSSLISKQIYAKDERQPDFLACWLWGSVLINELSDNMHLMFDGSPRSINEAKLMTSALNFYKREKPTVIHINVSRKWSETHLLARGRSDDVNLAKIDKRLDWFEQDVVPAIEYFKDNPYYRFFEVNGEQSIEAVHAEIIAAHDYSS
ncbi:nucleoside monophosphate kinase [Candidatus Parcubacteria bacterium]|nr:nucleoside monophosphate kinase [Candidatus Parcubacteria bacterium]